MAVAVTVVSALGVYLLWRVFVLTLTGQRVDQAAFNGSEIGQIRLWRVAEPVLDVMSVPFIGVTMLAVVVLAVLRRRLELAVHVGVLVVGANLTTQLLKRVVLDRPVMGVDRWHLDNTLPSGHTTAAASVSAALVLVVPARLRPAAALAGVAYTGATGMSTLVGRWHRPSDVVAAVLVVLAWYGVVVAVAGRNGRSPMPASAGSGPTVTGLLLGVGGVAGGVAVLALQLSTAKLADGGLETRAGLLTAYAGGGLGAAAAVCLAFGTMLALSDAPEVVERPRASPARPGKAPAVRRG